MKRVIGTILQLAAGGRRIGAPCLLSFMFLLFVCSAAAQAGPFLDYLHVEANDGDSSGGHTALRFDRYTFHFQHEADGLIRIRRYDSAAFDYAYAKVGNRPIHQSRIAVSDETYRFVEDAFSRFLLTQDGQLEYRDALRRDVGLLEVLLARQRGEHGAIVLPAAGYFLPEARGTRGDVRLPATGPPSPALLALRDAVSARYGADFLELRIAKLLEELSRIDLAGGAQVAQELSAERLPASHTSAAGRFYHAAHEVVALRVLQAALPLLPGSFWVGEDPSLALNEEEVAALAAYAGELEVDLVRLVQSRRSDRPFPLLVGMARLGAVRESVSRGRLVLLDLFDPAAAGEGAGAKPPHLAELERDLRQLFGKRRAEFFAADGQREANYAALERVGNLLLESARGRRERTQLRRLPNPSVPARGARFAPAVPDGVAEAELERAVALAREGELHYSEGLRSRYAYDLVGRNCVTELFSMLNRSMEELCETARGGRCTEVQVREESVRRLGGHIDATRGLGFIPVLSAGKVADRYRVAARTVTPSYRQEKMALMEERESALSVFLRESNTLTSTIYRPGPDDSFFLFFTDKAAPLRPLFGAFNVLAGAGETVYGVLTLPASGARHVVAGIKGIAFSVPELFFVNIRKGSMGYLKRTAEASGEAAGAPP